MKTEARGKSTFILRVLKLVFGLVIALALVLILAVKIWLPGRLIEGLQSAVRENCDSCELKITRAKVSVLPPGLGLFDVRLTAGSPESSRVVTEVGEVRATLRLRSLFSHVLWIEMLRLEDVKVKFTDSDGPSKKQADKESSGSDWSMVISKTQIQDGEFIYVRNTHGTSAQLNVHFTRASLSEMGTSPAFKDLPIRAQALARIEKTGEIDLQVQTAPMQEPLRVTVDMGVKDQDLADLTPFFKENAGVILKGFMRQGHGHVDLEGRKLTATVWAKYEDLDVTLVKMYDRSEVAAFFINLGQAVAMETKNKDRPKSDQVRDVTIQREDKESIVSFILRGMKEAALKVSMPSVNPK